jgi:hypothetical protein
MRIALVFFAALWCQAVAAVSRCEPTWSIACQENPARPSLTPFSPTEGPIPLGNSVWTFPFPSPEPGLRWARTRGLSAIALGSAEFRSVSSRPRPFFEDTSVVFDLVRGRSVYGGARNFLGGGLRYEPASRGVFAFGVGLGLSNGIRIESWRATLVYQISF